MVVERYVINSARMAEISRSSVYRSMDVRFPLSREGINTSGSEASESRKSSSTQHLRHLRTSWKSIHDRRCEANIVAIWSFGIRRPAGNFRQNNFRSILF